MALRSLLGLIDQEPAAGLLAARAVTPSFPRSLRPYLLAALTRTALQRAPALVVVGDDRAARDLACDLRAWLSPRRVRYYPSRGVAYESHLTPPAHLVGLRVAALDALLEPSADGQRSRRWSSSHAVALSRRCPIPSCVPTRSLLRVGELLDLEECASRAGGRRLRARRPGLRARPVRGARRAARRLRGHRGARRARGHVRRRDRIAALVLDLHPALLGEVDEVEIAPAAELAAEHRELAEISGA